MACLRYRKKGISLLKLTFSEKAVILSRYDEKREKNRIRVTNVL